MSPTIKKVTNPSPSEIDDIFTRKAGAVTPKTNSGLKQKKRKKKTTKTQLAEPKRPAPEIILDPSTQKSTPKTISHDRLVPPRKRQKVVETKSDQDKFRDSRGTGPRRKTDDGFNIYKEDELGINAEAGGTRLCPFDCDCCF